MVVHDDDAMSISPSAVSALPIHTSRAELSAQRIYNFLFWLAGVMCNVPKSPHCPARMLLIVRPKVKSVRISKSSHPSAINLTPL